MATKFYVYFSNLKRQYIFIVENLGQSKNIKKKNLSMIQLQDNC